MPDYLSPGVYVEEITTGSAPIVGVSTSTTGMIGVTERGPINFPILVTSMGEYAYWFGGNLNILDFNSGSEAYCYLPYAVQGFFTNGGQLLYITRIIDESAAPALTYLFDRNTSSTLLLRAAGVGTGTLAAPPSLYLLDTTVITGAANTPTYFRVGNDSSADFVVYDSTNSSSITYWSDVPLNFALSRSHAPQPPTMLPINVAAFSWTSLSGVGAFQIVNPVIAGATVLVLSGLASDITALVTNVSVPGGQLLEIGTTHQGEYRFAIKAIAAASGTQATVTLDSGLAMSYAANAPATPLTPPSIVPPSPPVYLGSPAAAGDAVIFLNGSNASFQPAPAPSPNLVVIQLDDTTNREVRRIGTLTQLTPSAGAYAVYPVGSTAVEVTPADDNVQVAGVAPAVGATSMTLDNVTGLLPGTKLAVGPSSSSETITINLITPVAANPPQGTITFTPPLANATHTVGSTVTPQVAATSSHILSPAPAVGAISMILDNVTGLFPGTNLSVGPPSSSETITILTNTPDAASPPQGTITFTPPLANATHTVGSTVTPQGAATPSHILGATPAVGATSMILDNVTGLLHLTNLSVGPPSSSETITINLITPDAANPPQGTITFTPPLANAAHTVGSTVTLQGTATPSHILGATPAVGATAMTVTDVSGLAAGMTVAIGGSGATESVTIQSVTPDPTPALDPQGTIVFTPPLTNAQHVFGSTITPAGATLTAAAAAGATIITLSTRLGLSVGDLLRIDAASQAEYLTIRALPSAGGPPPDAGNVVLSAPLSLPHASGAVVRRQHAPTQAALQPSVAFIAAQPGDDTLYVTDGTDYMNGEVVQVTTPAGQAYYHVLDENSSTLTNVGQIYATTPLENSHAASTPVVQVNPLLTVQALDVGSWGNRLQVAVQDEPAGLVSGTTLATIISPTQIKLASSAGVESGTILQLKYTTSGNPIGAPVKVALLNRTNMTITLSTPLTADQINAYNNAQVTGQPLVVQSCEFSITTWWLRQPDPAIPSRNTTALDSEVFHNLSMDPRHSRYVQTIIGEIGGPTRLSDGRPDGQSWYIRVYDWAQKLPAATMNTTLWSVRLGPEILTDVLPTGQTQPSRQTLEGGGDSIETLEDGDYIGSDAVDPVNRTGLFTLMNVDEISIIACPGQTSVTIQQALITQCETMLYRFAVLDGPPPPDDSMNDVMAQRQQFDTKYAALYYPWLTIDDPYPKNLNNIGPFAIPPSGHVIGIYAQTDQEIGVFKAPANVVVNGITGLQRTLYKPQQDILNPYPVNINVIRDFRMYDRGIVVYGARVITSDTDWLYVNVRRLLIYIEASLYQGLQWAVFGDNSEPLWSQIRRSISNFLTTIWRNGGLTGATADQAFFVKCDLTTMTQTDIENGRLIAIVGVAPVYPAEFVIVRIGLWAPPSSS